MSIYERPDSTRSYFSKFVRVGEVIAVTDPEDRTTSHESLAKKEGLLETVKKLIKENPDEVDGGFVDFDNSSSQKPYIVLDGTSSTLRVPRNENARRKTIEVFSAKTPGCLVKNIYKFDRRP